MWLGTAKSMTFAPVNRPLSRVLGFLIYHNTKIGKLTRGKGRKKYVNRASNLIAKAFELYHITGAKVFVALQRNDGEIWTFNSNDGWTGTSASEPCRELPLDNFLKLHPGLLKKSWRGPDETFSSSTGSVESAISTPPAASSSAPGMHAIPTSPSSNPYPSRATGGTVITVCRFLFY